ncbi:MAG: N-acetyl-alpha-D-glucosaminyl L-malate synthase BshA [Firmicutes bacterium]|nr:N-acetyl-alpha-D-glucosaminyl L-malate synthase BshA [Bacillota bacterium]
MRRAGKAGSEALRIAMVGYPAYGGSGVVAAELGLALARRGHEVHLVSYELPFRLRRVGAEAERLIRFHRVEVPRYPLFDYPPYELALTNKLVDVARRQQIDLFHVHYAIPHAAAAELAREILAPRRLPVVTTLHGTDISLIGRDPSFREVTAHSIRRSDAVTAVSRWLAEETARQLAVPPPLVIPNFVDAAVYRRRPQRRLAAEGELLVCHVSNFRPVKRVDAVVRIFARVAAAVPARLLMAGDGPELGAAEAEVDALGVGERVHFLGRRDDVADILGEADVLLLPSATESFGLVALEAMAAEAVVVASDRGGLPEVVSDGETGFLFPPEAEEAMAEAVVALARDPERRRAMGRAARRRALRHFGVRAVVGAYEQLYRSLADVS